MFKNRKNLVSISSMGRKKTVKRMQKSRSCHPEMFYKKGILKNFAKFAGKHLCWSLSLTFTGLRCFHVSFAKFLRTSNLQNICKRLILKIMFISIQLYNNWHNLLKQFPHITD